jgi:hypothetical protein
VIRDDLADDVLRELGSVGIGVQLFDQDPARPAATTDAVYTFLTRARRRAVRPTGE